MQRSIDPRWRGRVALVTGASAGIGRAIAAALARGGMKVVATTRRLDRLRGLADEVADTEGCVEPVACDLRVEADIAALFERARERFGGVDIVINNAGLGHDAPLLSGDTESWREMLEVNVLALCIATREAVADMVRRNAEGYVIHVASMSAHRVPSGSGVYSATKFAVRSLTEGLRQELRALGAPIRVTAISPGFVETEFAALYHQSEAAAQATYSRYPVLQSSDIANAVVFLLSQPAHVQYHDLLLRPTEQPS